MSKKVFVDAGHSGVGSGLDCGAIGNGLYECNINLAVSKRVEYHLKRHGISVLMSRQDGSKEIGLSDRPRMANNWGADCFISIHCNSASFSAYGIETFAYKTQYRAMADKVHNRLIANTSLYYANRGVKFADFCVLRETNMSACLVEMAFISNERDSQLLRTKQEEYAIAISKGVLDYLGMVWKDEVDIPPQPSSELYRVRKSWADSKSQLGAYSILENAKANCPVGYSVFDHNGNCVYTNSGSKPTPPPKPSMANVDVFYKFDNLPWVKNSNIDNAGLDGVCARNLYAYPSKGKIIFRVSKIGGSYYPWVSNVYDSLGRYDFAGNGVPIDRIQMKLEGLNGYSAKYKVQLVDGRVLPWVYDDSDYAGIQGYAISNIWVEIVPR